MKLFKTWGITRFLLCIFLTTGTKAAEVENRGCFKRCFSPFTWLYSKLAAKCREKDPIVKIHVVPLTLCVGCIAAGACNQNPCYCLTGCAIGCVGWLRAPRDVVREEELEAFLPRVIERLSQIDPEVEESNRKRAGEPGHINRILDNSRFIHNSRR